MTSLLLGQAVVEILVQAAALLLLARALRRARPVSGLRPLPVRARPRG
jgi:hypothetical protein